MVDLKANELVFKASDSNYFAEDNFIENLLCFIENL